MSEAIFAHELKKRYPPDVTALAGLGVAVDEGTIFGLLGPNGAGKSTTVKILTTLTRADEGEARVAGFDVRAEPGRVRRAIGLVGQKPGFDADATGVVNLVFQGTLYGLHSPELKLCIAVLLPRLRVGGARPRRAKTDPCG